MGVFILDFFFLLIFGKVSEQYDQVARKLNFRLETTNNDLEQKALG